MKDQNDWDLYFLEEAKLISTRSKDPSTKVGSLIVDKKNRFVSKGYNGLPQRINDDPEILNNREKKYEVIIHGEMNAIIFAQRDLSGCTLYTYPFLPCSRCASMVIQAGITRVVAPKNNNPRWEENLNLSKKLFKEAEVCVIEYEI